MLYGRSVSTLQPRGVTFVKLPGWGCVIGKRLVKPKERQNMKKWIICILLTAVASCFQAKAQTIFREDVISVQSYDVDRNMNAELLLGGGNYLEVTFPIAEYIDDINTFLFGFSFQNFQLSQGAGLDREAFLFDGIVISESEVDGMTLGQADVAYGDSDWFPGPTQLPRDGYLNLSGPVDTLLILNIDESVYQVDGLEVAIYANEVRYGVIPEPTTTSFLAGGLLLVGWYRQRHRVRCS